MPENTISAEDQLAVMRLIQSYCNYIDSGDADGYANNFLPDAVLQWSDGEAHGRGQIHEWVSTLINSGHVGGTPATLRHFVGLPLIEGTPERCTARTYCVIFDYNPEHQVRTPLVATYDDTCAKVDGKWFFQRRNIVSNLGAASRPKDLQMPGAR
ncbi:MAG TPA: nuclear transport factor 2 family protein [Dehalococcoidia bacterium]|nr:nuclear transport factor 2 family protein [Dehalococcoidia bacterium]